MRNLFQVLLAITAVFGLGLGLAFGGGVLYGRKTAKAAAAPAVATMAPGGGGRSGGAGSFGGAGGAGGLGAAGTAPAGAAAVPGQGGAQPRGTTGVIEKVEGATLTVRTQAGTTPVMLAPDTDVRRSVPAQPADLQAGQMVAVIGRPGADGAIQARSITISPPAGAPGSQGGGQRPQPSATPAGGQ